MNAIFIWHQDEWLQLTEPFKPGNAEMIEYFTELVEAYRGDKFVIMGV